MLNGFEKETSELSSAEIELIPTFISGLSKKVGKKNSITNKAIVQSLKNKGISISEPRVRKIINHIRKKGLIDGLIASSNGYYISTDIEEIKAYIDSLYGREEAIRIIREGFEAQIRRTYYK